MKTVTEDEISLCSMSMDDMVFGIETTKVREVLGRTGRTDGAARGSLKAGSPMASEQMRSDLRRVPLAPAYIAGVIPYRGEVLTTLSLRALLGGGRERPGSCVLVLDEEATGERLGLMVDGVAGVVTLRGSLLEPNPSNLDARSKALFDGVYRMPSSLIVRIDPARLNPARLAASGLFDEAQAETRGGASCVR